VNIFPQLFKMRRGLMLSVTSSAKEKLKVDLQKQEKDDETLIRIARSSSDPQQLGFFLDKEKEGDRVIEDNQGEKLLLIADDLAAILTSAVLDYGDTSEGTRFKLTHS
jgi:Fe-S cluster assembly iron-binding protein IscA